MTEDSTIGAAVARVEEHPALSNVPASTEFKRKSVQGGAVAVSGQVVFMVLQVGTTFILARLLSPSDYGLQSMVVTLTAFFSLFKDAGLSVATVQREKLTHEQTSTLFWINVALGFFLMIVVAAMGPLLVRFYREPRLLWITAASATVFFSNSLAVQHKALMDRAMRFATTTKIDIFCNTLGAIVAITMAALGCGYWSLICQTIFVPIVSAMATWMVMPWMPGRPCWSSDLRSMIRFGGTVTLNSLVVYVAYNVEKVLLGRFWGATSLGIYGRAYQLATLPVQQLIGAVHTVAFSMLSRLQGEVERLQRAYLKSLSVIVSLTIPVVISSALFANEIVRVVLGPKWLQATLILRLLAPTVMVLALVNPFSWFLRATGQVGRSLKIAFMICPVVILGIVAGLHYGPPGVAMGYSAAMLALLVPIVAWATHGTGITARAYWGAINRPLLAGVAGGIAGWLIRMWCLPKLESLPLLILEGSIASFVYAGVLLFALGQKDFYFDLVGQIRRGKQAEAS